jgi:energy-coupling factor transporter ATP-binding protein EcfA2
MKVNNEIVLVRGLPGSGKSTLARKMIGYKHFEADMYLEVNGVYIYDSSKIRAAHDWCVASAKMALQRGENVVISNTFVKEWEMRRYVELGFPFKIVEMKDCWPNIHGVPLDRIEIMKNGWEKIPYAWEKNLIAVTPSGASADDRNF